MVIKINLQANHFNVNVMMITMKLINNEEILCTH